MVPRLVIPNHPWSPEVGIPQLAMSLQYALAEHILSEKNLPVATRRSPARLSSSILAAMLDWSRRVSASLRHMDAMTAFPRTVRLLRLG